MIPLKHKISGDFLKLSQLSVMSLKQILSSTVKVERVVSKANQYLI